MQIKNLIPIGNSSAVIIEKSLLRYAGLDKSAKFCISATRNGITIKSLKKEQISHD